jgi:GNAT superfamily N-acetyltransferase
VAAPAAASVGRLATLAVWFHACVDRAAVLAAFDEQVRRHPVPVAPGERVEREDRVVRLISAGDGFSGVTWSDLDDASADRVIAAQVERFAEVGGPWEWKHYSWDRPADLADRLRAAMLTPEPPEALLVGEIGDLPHASPPPPGVAVVPVVDERGASAFVSVHDEVFGGDSAWIGQMLLADLARRGGMTAALLAVAEETPVAALRLELAPETDFAVLYSACTLPDFRGCGVFRSLLARCVSLAAERGFRYLQTDALPDSQPILERLGCVELGTTTPFVHG